jgi:hypothetical protein
MRVLSTALAAAALTVLPVQAGASTPNAATEQTKPSTEAHQLHEGQAASLPSAEVAAADKKNPTEQTATQSGVDAQPKPDHSSSASSNEREVSPPENA